MSNHSDPNPWLRIADAADAQAITRLINAAFQVERFFLDADRIDIQEVRTRLGTGKFILAEANDALTGCVYVEPAGDRAYLGLLSVDPALQRSGIGRLLVDAAEDHCRAAGCHFMDLRIVNLRYGTSALLPETRLHRKWYRAIPRKRAPQAALPFPNHV